MDMDNWQDIGVDMILDTDMQNGYGARTWTRSMDMVMQNEHGRAE
jgi:hypothetical protein